MTTTPERPTDVRRTVHGQSAPSRTQTETETETSTTSSSLNDALARGRENETASTAAIRGIHPLDAMTAALGTLRPEWKPEHLRAVLARDRRPWRDVVEAALRAALNPDVRSPAAIENHDMRQYAATPIPPTLAERRAELARLTEEQA